MCEYAQFNIVQQILLKIKKGHQDRKGILVAQALPIEGATSPPEREAERRSNGNTHSIYPSKYNYT